MAPKRKAARHADSDDEEEEVEERKPIVRRAPKAEKTPPAAPAAAAAAAAAAAPSPDRQRRVANRARKAQVALNYSDQQRHYFIQVLMKRGFIMTDREALAELKKVHPAATEGDLNSFIAELSHTMVHLQYGVKREVTPAGPERYVALVNRDADGPTTIASTYKPEQINFIKHLIDHMATLPGGHVEAHVARNYGAQASDAALDDNPNVDAKKLRLRTSEAEAVLDTLVADKFLTEDRDGYGLGPRTFLELGLYLSEMDTLDDGLRKAMKTKAGAKARA